MECVTIENVDDLPLDDKNRTRTDIFCCCLGSLFALAMLTIAILMMNTNNYNNSNFPTDSDGIPCAYASNQKYPFLYFPNINDINIRVCVSSCPNSADPQLSCRVNSVVTSCQIPNIYSASVNFGRLGGFCAPNDEAAQQKLIQTANLLRKWHFMDIVDTIKYSLLISLSAGILWCVLVQLLPKAIASSVTILSVITLATGGLIAIFDSAVGITTFQRLVIGIILLFLSIVFTSFLCLYRSRANLFTIFLDWTSQVLKQNVIYFLYVFVFIGFTCGLIALCLFQHLAYLSHSKPQHLDGDVYLKLVPNMILLVLNIVQFIWGLQFLKDSFNFILSGMAIERYLQKDIGFFDIFLRLLKYHFGSVVGGSFLNAFFNIFNFILQTLRCHSSGIFPKCAPCCDYFYDCHINFSELIRTDMYSYINITGIHYCNAARNCQNLIEQANIFVGSQSVLYFYRISAYCFSVGGTVIASYLIQKQKLKGEVDLLSLAIATLFSYCVINYFIDLHANVAEGLQIIYLIQNSIGRNGKLDVSKNLNRFQQYVAQLKRLKQDQNISC